MTTTTEEAFASRPCVVCGGSLRVRLAPWSARCTVCGTWSSSLAVAINEEAAHARVDEAARATGLKELRRRNYEAILDRIAVLRPLAGARLLDVGSAHGWFLEAAAARGLDATGVEPEEARGEASRRGGGDVRVGYFPDVIEDGETFDVITFNDVLEHIPDVRATLDSCARVLAPGGVLSINIPSADGLGYKVTQLLARCGARGPFERFWQYGLPSPHRHYFPRRALAQLVEESGFSVRGITALSVVLRDGLWERVHAFRSRTPASVVSFAALYGAAPILNRPAQSDIVLLLAQRDG
jgi:2-polyprenyl-3-methyl-5-hydroxy-6-metoxy-1,4-benzoquinol methylase